MTHVAQLIRSTRSSILKGTILTRPILNSANLSAVTLAATALLMMPLAGCRSENERSSNGENEAVNGRAGTGSSAETTDHGNKQQGAALEFPESLRSDDEELNAALEKAMRLCTQGDYAAFRALWSAREKPLVESQFVNMRQAATRIRIRGLERVAIEREGGEQEEAYVALAVMDLDLERLPNAERLTNRPDLEIETERKAILMFVREFDEWRLAHAPPAMRKYMKKKILGEDE